MSIERIRVRLSYELRKGLHLLSIPFFIALIYHLKWKDGYLPQVGGERTTSPINPSYLWYLFPVAGLYE
jgi:hypothetical protein